LLYFFWLQWLTIPQQPGTSSGCVGCFILDKSYYWYKATWGGEVLWQDQKNYKILPVRKQGQ
jgi:hypothetical protein